MIDINDHDLISFQKAAESAAKLGGQTLMQWLGKAESWEKTGPNDLVTQADFDSQTKIRELLLSKFPDHDFLGEEDLGNSAKTAPASGQDFRWIVDPLDGTTNFVHQLRSFSVSVALSYKDQIIVGAVFDPTTDELFSAAIGKGATLNSSPIKTGACQTLEDALVVLSLGSSMKTGDPQFQRFVNVTERVSSFRRLGSAALNLCYVGCGRVDAYWATTLQVWDVAAGLLIAQEAGAVLDDFDGKKFDMYQPRFCAAVTDTLFKKLQPLLHVEDC